MLKFNLKPTGNLGLQEIQCYSVMLSPDLSFISGRTSYYNSILDGEILKVVNNKNKYVNICKVKAENVKVQGKVKLEITLPIKAITKKIIINDAKGIFSSCTKNYVEYNGAFSYECKGFYLVDGKLYKGDSTGVTIDTFAYIEDGIIKIGDKEYIADFRENGEPKIVEKIGAEPLKDDDKIDKYTTYKGVSQYAPSEWKRETKFIIYKDGNYELVLEDALFGGYEHYIEYEGENYYLQDLHDSDGKYIGYGVEIDGNKYTTILRQIYDGTGEVPYDNMQSFEGSVIRISEEDLDIETHPEVYYPIEDSLVSPVNGGDFVFLSTVSQKLDLKVGDTIIAQSNGPIFVRLSVSTDDNGKYIVYLGKRFDIETGIYKRIKVSDSYYRLIEEPGDGYDAYAYFGKNKIYYNVSGNKATPINKIYYFKSDPSGYDVNYGLLPDGYTIDTQDGVVIDDVVYMVQKEVIESLTDDIEEDEEKPYHEYIEISEDISHNLIVSEKSGSNLYLCYPDIDSETLYSNDDIKSVRSYVCNVIVYNKDNFTFYARNDIFGEKQIYPGTYLYDAAISTKPFCTLEKLNVSIFKVNVYANFKLPIVNGVANSILRDDIIRNDFSKSISDKSLTNIVDMEKDIYYPVWKNGDTYEPINCVRFNMHLRTRDMSTWKVIEDYVEDESEVNRSNWFVTDYNFYNKAILHDSSPGITSHTIHNASDLIGYFGFTDSEVKNRAKKIGKSFLRLSFFSTNDPQTQVLLGTSTIFMDESSLCKKYISMQSGSDVGAFINTYFYQNVEINEEGVSNDEAFLTDNIGVYNEPYDYDGLYDFEENSNKRLSSRIEVYDKHTTNNSSEGFYFYMFREYANNMRPLRIYLKIDFNHAGYGKTIPLMLPRINMEDDIGVPLYIHKREDLEILRNGFRLRDIYRQLYIPIDVIFDDKNNRYVYYLPEQIRENEELGVDNDIMEFNLFEVKFRDESVVENENNQ